MGGSTSLALGLALAQPDKSVVVVTGDGEQLMGIGSLATIAAKQPRNLTIVVLDNGHFGETGMQRSHTSLGTDLVAVAKGFGIADAFSVARLDGSAEIAERATRTQRHDFRSGLHQRERAAPRAASARRGVHQEPLPRCPGPQAVLARVSPRSVHEQRSRSKPPSEIKDERLVLDVLAVLVSVAVARRHRGLAQAFPRSRSAWWCLGHRVVRPTRSAASWASALTDGLGKTVSWRTSPERPETSARRIRQIAARRLHAPS